MSSPLDPDHPLTALRYLKTLCPDEDISSRKLNAFFDTNGVPHDGISCSSVSVPSRELDLHTYIALTDSRSCECGFYRGTPLGQSLSAVCSMCSIIRLSSLSVPLYSWPELYRLLVISADAPPILRSHIGSAWVSDFIDKFSAAAADLASSSVSLIDLSPLYDAIASHAINFAVPFDKSQDFHNWSQLLTSSLFEMRDLDAISRRRSLYTSFDSQASLRSGRRETVAFSTRRLLGSGVRRRPGGLLFLLASIHLKALSGEIVCVELPSEVVAGLDALFSNESFYAKTSSVLTPEQSNLVSQLWSDSPSDHLHSLSRVIQAVEGLS